MILVFIIVFCALIALGFGGAAAYSDATRLKIPNLYAAYIGAAFIPAFIAVTIFAPDTGLFSSLSNHLMAGGITLAITYALFFFKIIGGGDSKLLSVYALWAGLSGLMPLLFIMGVFGGALGVSTLVLNKHHLIKKPLFDSWIDRSQKGGQDVPYGVAIFVGALYTFWQIGFIQPDALIALATSGMGN